MITSAHLMGLKHPCIALYRGSVLTSDLVGLLIFV